MKKLLFGVLVLGLTGCQVPPGANTSVSVVCNADVNAPADLAAAGQIAKTIAPTDPTVANDVALASAVDLLVHPLVQQACGSAGVASVTTTAVPK